MIKKPRLIATDMDGTAVRNDHITMSERNRAALTRAAEAGIYVVPVTGRSLDVLPGGILPAYSHVITSNGASVYDTKAKATVLTRHLSHEEACIAWGILSQTPDLVEIFVHNKMGIARHHFENIHNMKVPGHHYEYYTKGSPLVIDSYDEFIKTDGLGIEKFYMPFSTCDATERAREELRATGIFDVSSSGDNNLELNKRGVDKGVALSGLCELLGVNLSDVVAFGDEANDLPMLRIVGYGVAMGNASAQVIETAKYRTCTNEEDGLAVFLEETFGI